MCVTKSLYLFFKDTMNQLFHEESINDKGTLYYLKAKYKHHSLKSNVMHNYQNVEDFLKVTIYNN